MKNENIVDAEVIDEETEMRFQGELNAKPEKKGFFTKVKEGVKTFPDKHPKLTKILIGAGGVAIGAVAAILITKKDNSDSDNVELLETSDDGEWSIDTDAENSETFDVVETDEEETEED